jgi:AbrB family looped-hinge helix DNA binding protein
MPLMDKINVMDIYLNSIKRSNNMITATIGRRGYITIPRNLRRQMGLKEGDRVTLVVQGDQIVLRPITQTLLDLRGSVPVTGPQDLDAIRQQVIAERAKRNQP